MAVTKENLQNTSSGAEGKNIIITGASKGIGKASADLFASKGHNLYLCSRTATHLYKTMEELITKYPGVTIKARPFDLGNKQEAQDFGNWCLEYGTPDILLNNAGMFEPGGVHNEPDGALESQIDTNLYSAYHVTRTVLPAMMEKKSGHIFNLCSIASLGAYDNGGAYSISKFALYGFSKNLRKEMMPHGIKVTAIIAGATYTDSWAATGIDKKRFMEAEDIALMIYAASQLSPQACVDEILMRPQTGDI